MTDKRNTYKLSSEFIKKLADISAGYLPPDKFDEVIKLFETEIARCYFTFSSESNLLRIILSMYDRISFLLECVKYPHYAEIIVSIAANSNYLSDILVINPEFFYLIVNPSNLKEKLNHKKFTEEIKKSLASYKSLNAKLNALRTIKRKEILRIGIKDILSLENLEETTSELSTLATVLTGELFNLCYSEVLGKYGVQKTSRRYCLVALGKLGGNELNYSSDIDLVIFYDLNTAITKSKNYNEILTEAVYLFIDSASSITSKGFIYRVDFRLRPDGRNSALCRSIEEYLNYYEIRGEDWERQMLIKAGFICGSKILYEKFTSYLQPFVYPVSFSTSPTEQIKKLKLNIEKNLRDHEDIKLAAGGIRDIEFSVQALQLLNGGRNNSLRTGHTLSAIEELKSASLLTPGEASVFNCAYRLYRKIEHYLQLMNDSQTHTIPQEGETLDKMSSFLGYKNALEFKKDVLSNREKVQAIFNSIMGVDESDESSPQLISYINFENKARALKDLQFLREGKGLLGQKQFDKKSISDFENIEPAIEKYLRSSSNPDLALQNFVRVLRPVMFPSIWYREFKDTKFFTSFLQLCEYSQKSIDLFAEDDDLREFFLTRKVFEKLSAKALESFSTKRILFTVTVQFSLNLISATDLSLYLSSYFRHKIKSLTENFIEKYLPDNNYAIASMGSFGAGETTLSSDIDLVFIVKDMNRYPEIQTAFQELFLKIQKELKPVEVDCRLRPEGKSSILAWDLKSYQAYVRNRARIWELQAFCKLDFIAGDKKIVKSLARTINTRILKESASTLAKEILDMRNKLAPQNISSFPKFFNIKKSRGGIADIDFLLQFIILSEGLYLKLRAKGSNKWLKSITSYKNNYAELEKLEDNFLFLKQLDLRNQCIFNSTSSVLPADENKLEVISKMLNLSSLNEFYSKLDEVVKDNRYYFEKYLG